MPADCGRCSMRDAQRLAEQQRADDQVGLLAGGVDEVAAQLARDQVEQQRQHRAGGQGPQRDEAPGAG